MTGHWVVQMLGVVARLGIADLLKDGPKSSQELAEKTGVNPDALFRVMRALCTADVFVETDAGVFGLSAVGRYLRSDVYGSIRWSAAMYADLGHWAPWSYAMESVTTGAPVAQKALGSSSGAICAPTRADGNSSQSDVGFVRAKRSCHA